MNNLGGEIWQSLQPGLSIFYLDRLHPGLGNKAYKLQPAIERAITQGSSPLVSLGGAWSNHLHALAQMGQAAGIATVGYVRGDANCPKTKMLEDAEAWGMTLRFLPRGEYRKRHDAGFAQGLMRDYPSGIFVPEGGSDIEGIAGVAQLVADLMAHGPAFERLVLPVGTGGTMAGVLLALKQACHVVGVSALKPVKAQQNLIDIVTSGRLHPGVSFEVLPETRFGGYAACPEALVQCIHELEAAFDLALEPIYTAKALVAALDLVQAQSAFSETLVLHTGGLQGRRGFAALA